MAAVSERCFLSRYTCTCDWKNFVKENPFMEITKIDNPPNVPYPVKKVSAGIACAQNVRAEVRSGHRHKHLTISKYELLIAIM